MNFPHYFIAIPLPAFLKEQLAGWQHDLKKELSYKQWTHPDDLHITLKFLGPVDDDRLENICDTMKKITRFQPFSLVCGSLGTFGDPHNPRVLWAGAEKKAVFLELQQIIDQIAWQAGFQQEKRAFFPHITLAKKWAGKKEDLTNLKKRYNEQQTIEVKQIVMYQIYPGSTPKYHVHAAFDLIGEDA